MKNLIFIFCILVFGCKTYKTATYSTSDKDSILIGYKFVGAVYSDGISYSVVYNEKYIKVVPDIYSSWFIPEKYFTSVIDVLNEGVRRKIVGNINPVSIKPIKIPAHAVPRN